MWSNPNDSTILVVDLQKSPVGNTFYINLGVFIRCLSQNSNPRINICQISDRLDTLVDEGTPSSRFSPLHVGQSPKDVKATIRQLSQQHGSGEPLKLTPEGIEHILRSRPRIDQALDLDNGAMSAEERKAIITHALLTAGLPFLQKCDSVTKICQALRTGSLSGAAVWKVVHDLCKTNPEGKRNEVWKEKGTQLAL
jgi:hypothetical protein